MDGQMRRDFSTPVFSEREKENLIETLSFLPSLRKRAESASGMDTVHIQVIPQLVTEKYISYSVP